MEIPKPKDQKNPLKIFGTPKKCKIPVLTVLHAQHSCVKDMYPCTEVLNPGLYISVTYVHIQTMSIFISCVIQKYYLAMI